MMTWKDIFNQFETVFNGKSYETIRGVGGSVIELQCHSSGWGRNRFPAYLGQMRWTLQSSDLPLTIQFRIEKSINMERLNQAVWNFPNLEPLIDEMEPEIQRQGSPEVWFNDLETLQLAIAKALFHPDRDRLLGSVLGKRQD